LTNPSRREKKPYKQTSKFWILSFELLKENIDCLKDLDINKLGKMKIDLVDLTVHIDALLREKVGEVIRNENRINRKH